MPLEDFSWMLSEIRRKLFYIAAVFGAGAIISFSYMGELIKKIEEDMFWRLNLPGKPDAAGQLIGISHNLSLISEQLAVNESVIAQNLTRLSGEILNISQNINVYKPNIVYLTPMEVLMLEFKMSLIVGALIASPLIAYYAYRGTRGRFKNIIPVKKSTVISITVAAAILFSLGAAYSYLFKSL